jgi:hypothetical protein
VTTIYGASDPFIPFPNGIDLPTTDPFEGDQVCVQFGADWVQIVIGCLNVLCAQSTWRSTDLDAINAAIQQSQALIGVFMELEACPVPIQFQVNPTYPQNWQYSLDAGVTWLDGPDVASHYTPDFVPDVLAPAGYDLSVNGDHTSAPIPLLTAADPNAIVKDPSSGVTQAIQGAASEDALGVGVGSEVGATIAEASGTSLTLAKMAGVGASSAPIAAIEGVGSYLVDLLALVV